MFKNAYTRGIMLGLVQSGRAQFADAADAVKVSDYIAERVDFDPFKPVPAAVTHKIAGHLIEAAEILAKQPGFKAAAFGKVESWDEVAKIASDNAVHLMELAAEKTAEGSTIEGADKGNDEAQSPAGETRMDAKQRPPGYAEGSLGKTDVDVRPGQVGKEEEQPNAPKETDKKDNSLQEQSRTASLKDIMRKIAEGSTIMGGDKGNKEMSSAEAKMDAAQRPEGYGTLPSQGGLGALMSQMKGPAVVGRETAQPNKPAESPSGSNSLTQHSAKAAAEDPYVALFKKTASEIIEYLPQHLGEEEKIAHVRACMGLKTAEKAHYLTGLQKEASAKTAGAPAEVPPGSRGDKYTKHDASATHSRPGAYDGRGANQAKAASDDLPPFMSKKDDEDKKDDDGEKKDLPPWMKSKDDGDKKDDDKEKEAAMRTHLRRLEEAVRAGR
jgi:hypothetical protein